MRLGAEMVQRSRNVGPSPLKLLAFLASMVRSRRLEKHAETPENLDFLWSNEPENGALRINGLQESGPTPVRKCSPQKS